MPERRLNLLLFGVDSLRADHMSCYGYPRLTTPHIDGIASEGVLFENAFSPYIPTTPGYTSMLTGMDVVSHQIVSLSPKGPVDPSIRFLGEVLHDKGYVSACVGFNPGFYRGFDRYADYHAWMAYEDAPGHKAEALNEKAIPLLESMVDKPFFLFLRHMDPHAPYLPPPPFPRMFYGAMRRTLPKIAWNLSLPLSPLLSSLSLGCPLELRMRNMLWRNMMLPLPTWMPAFDKF